MSSAVVVGSNAGSSPRGRPRDQAKLQAILEAAGSLFLERGFEAASMDAIAAEAGVAKATLYARFPDKEAMFVEVLRHTCEASVDPSYFAFDAERSPRQFLIDFGTKFLELVNGHKAIAVHRVIVAESVRAPRVAELFFEAAVLRVKECFVAWVEAENAIGRLSVADPDGSAWRFLGAVRSEAHMRASIGLPPVPPERLAPYVEACADEFLLVNAPRR